MTALFARECAACHGPDANLVLPDAVALDLLQHRGTYVVPLEPDASQLWRILVGALAEGDADVMPLGTGPLPDDTIAPVRAWIAAGAAIDWREVDLDGDGATADVDCDETNAKVHPGAPDVCNGLDDDCDGSADPDTGDASTWYADRDDDGYGDPAATTTACAAPAGHVATAGDCDDGAASVHPGAVEVLDGRDDDCDGVVDEDTVAGSHAVDIQPIWDADCTLCHGSRTASGDLDLSGNGYDDLVNVASGQLSSMDRVAPGDTATSYLWHKLRGTHLDVGGSGTAMPKAAPLSAADLATIEGWILGGALP